MEKEIINPSSLARPVGFSHGIAVTGGRLLFLAGQTGSDAEGRITAPGNIVAQYEQIMRNFQAVVEAAGGTMQDITKLNIFVRDRDDYLAHLEATGPRASRVLWPVLPGDGAIRDLALLPGRGVDRDRGHGGHRSLTIARGTNYGLCTDTRSAAHTTTGAPVRRAGGRAPRARSRREGRVSPAPGEAHGRTGLPRGAG